MSENQAPTGIRNAPPRPMVLSRFGLLLLVVVFMGFPLVLIAAVWVTLPPVREKPLEAQIRLEDFIEVTAFREMSNAEKEQVHESIRNNEFMPVVVVENVGEEDWENLVVSINGTFDFISPEKVLSGGEVELYLHRFQTRQGDGFRPLEYEIRKIRIVARLPTHERAYFEREITREGDVIPPESSPSLEDDAL